MPLRELDSRDIDFIKNLPWLRQGFFGNSLYAYTLAMLTFVTIWIGLYFIRFFILKRIERYCDERPTDRTTQLFNFIRDLLRGIQPAVFPLVALYFGARRLSLAPSLQHGIKYVTITVVTLQALKLISDLIGFLINRSKIVGSPEDPVALNTSQNLVVLAKVALWVAGILFLLDNLGINVSTFIAGLGIGGVAIALAAQAILGDTFSSFAIALDKPFEVGDAVNVDDLIGTVEHIGLKTTRVRSLSGELLIFGNSDLTRSRIRNYKRMQQRRVNFQIGVEYGTPIATLKKIPTLIKEAVESTYNTNFDRAHFFKYGDYALIFDIVYWVTSPDYNLYMDIQQDINFKIHDAFSELNIEMAFPTQTIIARYENQHKDATRD